MVEESWMHSFDPLMKWQNAEWHTQTSRKKIAQHGQGVLKVMHIMFFSQNGLVVDHCVPISTNVNGQYYCTLLQDKVRPDLNLNNHNCLCMVSFCSRTMQCLIAIVICKIWYNIGTGRCWNILPTLQISPHVINVCFKMWKHNFGVNNLKQKMISTLLSLPLYIGWTRMNT
jgi:hypothetical protein